MADKMSVQKHSDGPCKEEENSKLSDEQLAAGFMLFVLFSWIVMIVAVAVLCLFMCHSCPACGRLMVRWAHYCSSCGSPIT